MDKKELIISGLKGVASEVPILGGLVTAYNEYDNAIKYKNIEHFLFLLTEESSHISNRLDNDYVKTQEAVSLTRKTIDLAQKEYKEEKIKMYATFLANSYSIAFSSREEKEAILNVVELLSPLQLSCLVFLRETLPKESLELGVSYDPDAKEKEIFRYHFESTLVKYAIANAPGITEREAEALLSSMVSIGVIENQSTRGWVKVGDKTGVTGFRLTKLGLIVLEFLSKQEDN